jgi:hypothetical protein
VIDARTVESEGGGDATKTITINEQEMIMINDKDQICR